MESHTSRVLTTIVDSRDELDVGEFQWLRYGTCRLSLEHGNVSISARTDGLKIIYPLTIHRFDFQLQDDDLWTFVPHVRYAIDSGEDNRTKNSFYLISTQSNEIKSYPRIMQRRGKNDRQTRLAIEIVEPFKSTTSSPSPAFVIVSDTTLLFHWAAKLISIAYSASLALDRRATADAVLASKKAK